MTLSRLTYKGCKLFAVDDQVGGLARHDANSRNRGAMNRRCEVMENRSLRRWAQVNETRLHALSRVLFRIITLRGIPITHN